MSDVDMNMRESAANSRQKRRVNRGSDGASAVRGAAARGTEPVAARPRPESPTKSLCFPCSTMRGILSCAPDRKPPRKAA